MALDTPTTQEINDQIIAQLQATLNQTIPLLPKSFLRVLAKVLAGVFIILYKYVGFSFQQTFVRTAAFAETEVNGVLISPLKEWGQLIGVGLPAPATQAELTIDITVDNQTGTLSTNSQLVGSINGVTYITIGAVLLNAATVTANIRAVSDQAGGSGAGTLGNLANGATVSFANPLANVARDALVASTTVTGANGEGEDAYRQRVLDRFQNEPQGGALADYRQWAVEPAGILRAYPYTSVCPGQVDVYIEATVASSGNPDGIPTTAQLTEALDSINTDVNGLADRRPANALANTFGITRTVFDVTVSGLNVDNVAQVQSDITAGIIEYFLSKEPFIVGLSVNPRLDIITRSAVAGLVEDIVTSAGGFFTAVVVKQNLIVIDLYFLGIGEKAKSGTVTYL